MPCARALILSFHRSSMTAWIRKCMEFTSIAAPLNHDI